MDDLRISVIDRCNFRCPYCMPEEDYSKHYVFLKEKEWLSFDEITRLTLLFVNLGVTKIRLTGGEPLLRMNIHSLIQKLATIEGAKDLTLTTNGSLLEENAARLRNAGLLRLTVSLDALDDETFRKMSGNKFTVEKVLRGIEVAEQAGFKSIKINTVVEKGVNDKKVIDIIKYFRGTGHIVRFIEYMDVGNCNHWNLKNVLPSKEIVNIINEEYPLKPLDPNYKGEVASRYAYKDGQGEIGFISSITQPFCGTCSRARLSTDGKIYTCLFSDKGFDIRTPLREGQSDEELTNFIKSIWSTREDRYSELRSEILPKHQPHHKVEMFQIGG